MGRLSPRTRNAQVALYQDKEVDFLVATDAIGMGLNMDVDHVAFAALGKFDGHRPRRLTAAEIAQIAGRAGRGMRDGTFGTTADCPPLADELVARGGGAQFRAARRAVLAQQRPRFRPCRFAARQPRRAAAAVPAWSAATMRRTWKRSPRWRASPKSAARAGQASGAPLWEACQIPDFRKLADDTHAGSAPGCSATSPGDGTAARPTGWPRRSRALARADGDIDTLMQRLAGVRIWSYIAARPTGCADARIGKARAREVEDLLSDALHERLTTRFVDRRSAHLLRRLDAGDGQELLSAVTRRGEVVVEGHPVGRIGGFSFFPDPAAQGDEKRLVLRAARRALRAEMPRRVALLEAAEDAAFALTDEHAVLWDGVPLARLQPGTSALRPRLQVLDSEFLDGAQRERLRLRIQGFLDERIRADLAPLHAAARRAAGEASLRGPLHRLSEALGLIPRRRERNPVAAAAREAEGGWGAGRGASPCSCPPC